MYYVKPAELINDKQSYMHIFNAKFFHFQPIQPISNLRYQSFKTQLKYLTKKNLSSVSNVRQY